MFELTDDELMILEHGRQAKEVCLNDGIPESKRGRLMLLLSEIQTTICDTPELQKRYLR